MFLEHRTGHPNKLFKELEKKLNEYLAEKRRPFLKKQANMIIKNFEKTHVMPKFGENSWDLLRKRDFVDFVKNLYEVRPSMFVKLSVDQQRIFLELLNLVMDSNERNSLFCILDSILDLSSDDRKEFSDILKTTRLKQILSTINLIKDRILVIEDLKKVLFDHTLKAGEVNHLQRIIVNHYWIFGEEYNLVCAEEVKFTKVLEKYRYLLLGVEEKEFITHPDKYKEMDLFLTGQDFQYSSPHNLVVEIKSPTRVSKLSYTEFGQIQRYGDVITSTDAFNDHRERWSFILIGQDVDSKMADSVIKNKESGWAYTKDNASYYIKTWAQVINDVEFRHKFLLDKLQLQRKNLSESTSLDGIMNDINNNHAAYK